MEKTKVTYMDVDSLIPYANNPRLNDNAVDSVAASIKEFGFKVPIVVDSENVIINGHTRLKAAHKLGLTQVPVIVADDLAPEQVKALGYDAMGVEFFNNNGKAIDVSKGNRMIDALVKRLREQRQFDVVVCDSVLNSVDSMKAERSVIDFLNLVASDRLFISGRPLDAVAQMMKLKKDVANEKRFVEFLDADNFSANYRSGKWYFQHYHSKEQVKESLEESGFEIVKLDWRKWGDSWQCEAIKTRELPSQRYIDAIDFEFDLPLPNGRSYKRNGDVKRALGLE